MVILKPIYIHIHDLFPNVWVSLCITLRTLKTIFFSKKHGEKMLLKTTLYFFPLISLDVLNLVVTCVSYITLSLQYPNLHTQSSWKANHVREDHSSVWFRSVYLFISCHFFPSKLQFLQKSWRLKVCWLKRQEFFFLLILKSIDINSRFLC